MAAAEAGEKKMITLKSSDGEEFEVEEAVAMKSQTIRHMIENDCADNGIPLTNVYSKILSKVIEYCDKHVQAKPADAAAGGAGASDAAAAAPAAPAEDLKSWDAEFVKVDQATLFDLILHCPAFRLELSDDGGIMSNNLDTLLTEIADHIRNNIWGQNNGQQNGLVEDILALPKGVGHYIVELIPVADWEMNNVGDIRLLFDFDDAYFVGFERNHRWFVVADHYEKLRVRGTIDLAESNVTSLGFGGNYNNLKANFESISISLFSLIKLYKGLAGYPGSSIKQLLLMGAVCFSETIRFPRFRQYVLNRISNYASDPEDIQYEFSDHFLRWSVYSRHLRLGRAAFVPEPDSDIQAFDDLLGLVSMVL